jgi:transposase-like protein
MTIAEAARVHDVHPETVRLWRRNERKYGDRAFAGNGRAYTDEAKIAQLERALGQMTLENALLKKALTALKGTGANEPAESDDLAGIRRAQIDCRSRDWPECSAFPERSSTERRLKTAIGSCATRSMRSLSTGRATATARSRANCAGMAGRSTRSAFAELMREEGLSDGLQGGAASNTASTITNGVPEPRAQLRCDPGEPTLGRGFHLRAHFRGRFIFVAVILDAYQPALLSAGRSRRTFAASLIIVALRVALRGVALRQPASSTIPTAAVSTSKPSTSRLLRAARRGQISMSRGRRHRTTRICERFVRTIKDEEVNLRDYRRASMTPRD